VIDSIHDRSAEHSPGQRALFPGAAAARQNPASDLFAETDLPRFGSMSFFETHLLTGIAVGRLWWSSIQTR